MRIAVGFLIVLLLAATGIGWWQAIGPSGDIDWTVECHQRFPAATPNPCPSTVADNLFAVCRRIGGEACTAYANCYR